MRQLRALCSFARGSFLKSAGGKQQGLARSGSRGCRLVPRLAFIYQCTEIKPQGLKATRRTTESPLTPLSTLPAPHQINKNKGPSFGGGRGGEGSLLCSALINNKLLDARTKPSNNDKGARTQGSPRISASGTLQEGSGNTWVETAGTGRLLCFSSSPHLPPPCAQGLYARKGVPQPQVTASTVWDLRLLGNGLMAKWGQARATSQTP